MTALPPTIAADFTSISIGVSQNAASIASLKNRKHFGSNTFEADTWRKTREFCNKKSTSQASAKTSLAISQPWMIAAPNNSTHPS